MDNKWYNLYKKFKKLSNETAKYNAFIKYKSYKMLSPKLFVMLKTNIGEKFHLSTNNSKETWKNINEVMNRKSNLVQKPEYFVTENGIIRDPYLTSNQLNNYFDKVGSDI